ncbi:MAG: hypothetical protein ACLFRV_04790 [Acidimicrobiales bacterium]
MSSAYDPRRSRPRPPTPADANTAPVEALLGPDPVHTQPAASNGSTPAATPTVAAGTYSGAPSRLVQLSPLLVAGSLLAALVWWLTRRRD